MSVFDLDRMLGDLRHRVHILETTQPMGYSSVSEGRSRFVGNESLLVQGSAKVEGWLVVTGTERITGLLDGSGNLIWTGPWELAGSGKITGPVGIDGNLTINGSSKFVGPMTVQGTWDFTGNGKIQGNVDITGALDVKNRLTLGTAGYIEAGTVRIDRGGSYGGRIRSTGSVLALSAAGSVVVDNAVFVAGETSLGKTTCLSLDVVGAVSAKVKNFRIPHPTKRNHYLLHGSTESPVSGVEYWGEEKLPESGELVVSLPDYFEALTEPENRAVLVTARGFIADWGDIEGGEFVVSGKPGGRFSWVVKAERANAEFLVEEPVSESLRE